MQVTIVVPDTTPEQRRLPMERMGARVLVRLPDSTSQLPDSTSHVARGSTSQLRDRTSQLPDSISW